MFQVVTEVRVERTFAAPAEQVWAAYTDHAGWKEWAGVGRSWLEKEGSPERNGSGAVRGLGPAGFSVFEEILEFEESKRMTYRVLSGGIPIENHSGEVIFEPRGDWTRVVWSCRFDSKIPGLGWLFRALVTRVFRTALDGLARKRFPHPA